MVLRVMDTNRTFYAGLALQPGAATNTRAAEKDASERLSEKNLKADRDCLFFHKKFELHGSRCVDLFQRYGSRETSCTVDRKRDV
jgi:hypothetical protein